MPKLLCHLNIIYIGTIGDIGVFSLNYHKHIHTGEGGICCTNNKELDLRMRAIRNHGENIITPAKIKNLSNMIGLNFRMTELSAAVGLVQLKKIDKIVKRRIKIVKRLNKIFSNVDNITIPEVRDGCVHVYYDWVLKLQQNKNKSKTKKILKAIQLEGVPIFKMSLKPLNELPVFKSKIAIGKHGWPFTLSNYSYSNIECPNSKIFIKDDLYELPICAFQFEDYELNKIELAVDKVLKNINKL